MRARRLAVAALVAATASGVPAAIARPPEVVAVLTQDTVITFDHSASMLVDLPNRAYFSSRTGSTVIGRGRFYGVVLKTLAAGNWTPIELSVIANGYCSGSGCVPRDGHAVPSLVVPSPDSDGVGGGTMPAGRYRLYAIADGAPVRVTLHLPGLHLATRHLTPAVATGTAVVVRDLPATQNEPPPNPVTTANVYSAGPFIGRGRYGIHVHAVTWHVFASPYQTESVGFCQYGGPSGQSGPPPGVAPYQEPCLDSDLGGYTLEARQQRPPYDRHLYYSGESGGYLAFPGRLLNMGGYADEVGICYEAHVQVVAITFMD